MKKKNKTHSTFVNIVLIFFVVEKIVSNINIKLGLPVYDKTVVLFQLHGEDII